MPHSSWLKGRAPFPLATLGNLLYTHLTEEETEARASHGSYTDITDRSD